MGLFGDFCIFVLVGVDATDSSHRIPIDSYYGIGCKFRVGITDMRVHSIVDTLYIQGDIILVDNLGAFVISITGLL
jgi:hypothetical protein